jgi:hypothetical protein
VHDADRKPPDGLSKRRDQRPIRLDGEDIRPEQGQGDRQRSEACADLQHPLAGRRAGLPGDRACHVPVGEEMLPERLPRPDAVPCGQLGQPATGERLTR